MVELDGVIIDYSKVGRVVSIEILDAGNPTTKGFLDLPRPAESLLIYPSLFESAGFITGMNAVDTGGIPIPRVLMPGSGFP